MIEKTILDYLTSNLSVPVYMEIPDSPPEKFVIVDKTGSGRNERINNAIIAIQSYAGTMYEAASLNETVKTAMDSIAELDSVCKSSLNSDYNFTDTVSKKYRYQAVFDVVFY